MSLNLILLIAILNQISFGGGRIAVSLNGLSLGASHFTMGILISLFALLPMLLSIPIGRWVDKTAPRRIMILGSAVQIAALALPFIAPSLPTLFVTATLLGLAHPLFLIPIEAGIGGVGGEKNRVRNYAVIAMAWSFSNFLGPVIAGIAIDHVGFQLAFLLLVVIVVPPTVMLMLLPSMFASGARNAHAAQSGRRNVLELWRVKPVRVTLLSSAIIGSGMDLFNFYFPIYGHAAGLSASAIGTVVGVISVSAFILRSVLPAIARTFGELETLTYAIFVCAITFVLLPFFTSVYALAAIAMVLGLGMGCATPMTMALLYAQTPRGRIAEALGLQKSIRHTTQLTIPIIFGGVGTAFGFTPVFLACAAMLTAGGVLVSRLNRKPVD